MKTICSTGYLCNQQDIDAFNYYCLGTIRNWMESALKGMINKAIKNILNDYLEIYRTQNQEISSDLSVLIPAIIQMNEFKSYGIESAEKKIPERDSVANIQVLENGISIEDYEESALNAYFTNPSQVLIELTENKIALRKEAFYKEFFNKFISDPNVETIPSSLDGMIQLAVSDINYMNRQERDASLGE